MSDIPSITITSPLCPGVEIVMAPEFMRSETSNYSMIRSLATERDILQGKVNLMAELIAEFAKHDSWRCAYYSECHCGLDDSTDRLQLPRVPYPPQ